MRICIYGAGAMGCSLGYHLNLYQALGEWMDISCDFVSRNRAHVEAMRENGLQWHYRDELLGMKVSALLPEEMSGEYDIIFLATKQRENRQIAEFLLPFLAKDGAFVTVQNGLPEKELAEVIGADRVYGATLGWGAELEAPGIFKETSDGIRHDIAIGAYGKGERLQELANFMNSREGCNVTTGDLAEIRFAKLVFNASFSTLSAISGLTFGELAKKHRKLTISLIREVLCVAEVCGCKRLMQSGHDVLKLFKSPFSSLILPFAMKKHANIRSGMLRDIESGRRCDVDFVAGAVVRAGEMKGVDTPMLAQAVSLVHDIENGFAEIAPETLEFIY